MYEAKIKALISCAVTTLFSHFSHYAVYYYRGVKFNPFKLELLNKNVHDSDCAEGHAHMCLLLAKLPARLSMINLITSGPGSEVIKPFRAQLNRA